MTEQTFHPWEYHRYDMSDWEKYAYWEADNTERLVETHLHKYPYQR